MAAPPAPLSDWDVGGRLDRAFVEPTNRVIGGYLIPMMQTGLWSTSRRMRRDRNVREAIRGHHQAARKLSWIAASRSAISIRRRSFCIWPNRSARLPKWCGLTLRMAITCVVDAGAQHECDPFDVRLERGVQPLVLVAGAAEARRAA